MSIAVDKRNRTSGETLPLGFSRFWVGGACKMKDDEVRHEAKPKHDEYAEQHKKAE